MVRLRARLPGFTLIEAMIVVCIIGIMAAAIAPSLSELLSDHRQSSSAMDVVRLARRTRAQAVASGTAYLMRFRGANDPVSGFGLGTITVYAGMNTKCRQTPWDKTFTPAAGTGLGPSWLLHMGDYNPAQGVPRADDNGRQVIVLTARVGAENANPVTDLAVCYQPNGEVYTGPPLPLAVQTQPILFSITRTIDNGDGDSARGRERQVLLPVGGNARVR